jgi:hypothetical protein
MSATEPCGMSQEALKERPEEASRTDGPQARMARSGRPQQGLRRGVGLLAGFVGLALVGVLAYNVGTSYFALNGEWYGPSQMHVGPATISVETYMDLATYLNGSLSGSGKMCYHNPLGGGTTTVDLTVLGHRNADKVSLTFAASTATLGIPLLNIALGPGLDLQGSLTTSPAHTPVAGTPVAGLLINGMATAVTLSGGNGAFPVTLEMRRGVVAQFASVCMPLAPLGDLGPSAARL